MINDRVRSSKLVLRLLLTNGVRHSSSNKSRIEANFKYCLESVKANDYEAYMSTLVGPKELTRAAIAIRALNIELLSIPKHSREVNISIAKVIIDNSFLKLFLI